MFRLCEQWMCRQTFRGTVQWIVVDDGKVPTVCTAGQEYVRVERDSHPDRITTHTHTVGDNLRRALPLVRSGKVLVIEDDDYYSPRWVETLCGWLDKAELVGEAGSKYYRLDNQTFEHFTKRPFTRFAALARTGFRSELIPFIESCCAGDSSVDMRIWTRCGQSKYLHPPSISGLHISIKGGPGRGSHNHTRKLSGRDRGHLQLLQWTGGDWAAVEQYRRLSPSRRIIVFTAVTTGENGRLYSRLRSPVVSGGIRNVCFTDSLDPLPVGWERNQSFQDVLAGDSSRLDLQSRYWKILPHRWFPDADWTLYVDGSLKLRKHPDELIRLAESRWPGCEMVAIQHPLQHTVGNELDWIAEKRYAPAINITQQRDEYRIRGLLDLTAYQCGFMLRKNTPAVARLNELWWNDLIRFGHRRDQPSFPVAAHDAGVTVAAFSHSERASYTRWSGHNVERETFIS